VRAQALTTIKEGCAPCGVQERRPHNMKGRYTMTYIIKKLDSHIHYCKALSILHYYLIYSVGGETVEVTLHEKRDHWEAVSECAGYMHITRIPTWDLSMKALVLTTKEIACNMKFYADVCRTEALREIQKKFDK
jgi:hypothetical protein